mgnify:CR=1 FL=1|jgi:hypothetical protein
MTNRFNLNEEEKKHIRGLHNINEANGFKSSREFINIKLQNYPKSVAKINQLINMIGESNFTMEMAEWLFDFFNNASFEIPINMIRESKGEIDINTTENRN